MAATSTTLPNSARHLLGEMLFTAGHYKEPLTASFYPKSDLQDYDLLVEAGFAAKTPRTEHHASVYWLTDEAYSCPAESPLY